MPALPLRVSAPLPPVRVSMPPPPVQDIGVIRRDEGPGLGTGIGVIFDVCGRRADELAALDGVAVAAAVGSDHLADGVEDVGVVAVAAVEDVDARAAVEDVVAFAAGQGVVPRPAEQGVFALAAIQDVGRGAAGDDVVEVVAGEGPGGLAGIGIVLHLGEVGRQQHRGLHRIGTLAARFGDDIGKVINDIGVVAFAALESVDAALAVDQVIAVAAQQVIRAGRTIYRVVARKQEGVEPRIVRREKVGIETRAGDGEAGDLDLGYTADDRLDAGDLSTVRDEAAVESQRFPGVEVIGVGAGIGHLPAGGRMDGYGARGQTKDGEKEVILEVVARRVGYRNNRHEILRWVNSLHAAPSIERRVDFYQGHVVRIGRRAPDAAIPAARRLPPRRSNDWLVTLPITATAPFSPPTERRLFIPGAILAQDISAVRDLRNQNVNQPAGNAHHLNGV